MKFKALIFDLDGTAIPNRQDGFPSQKVIDAVEKAKQVVKVACATGREIPAAKSVIQALGLTSPCIVAGGAQIVDPFSFIPVWEEILSGEKIQEIVSVCKAFPYMMGALSDPGPEKLIREYPYLTAKPIVYIMGVPIEEKATLLDALGNVKDVNVHAVTAWYKGFVDIHITNKKASKLFAMEQWLEIEHVHKEEVIVIGDSGNDLALFESAGVKVAMGNASAKLKAKADWIAPTVDEDGVKATIEKYILL